MTALIFTAAASFAFGWLLSRASGPRVVQVTIERVPAMGGSDWVELPGGIRERHAWSSRHAAAALDRIAAQGRVIVLLTDRLREKHLEESDERRALRVVGRPN